VDVLRHGKVCLIFVILYILKANQHIYPTEKVSIDL